MFGDTKLSANIWDCSCNSETKDVTVASSLGKSIALHAFVHGTNDNSENKDLVLGTKHWTTTTTTTTTTTIFRVKKMLSLKGSAAAFDAAQRKE